MFTTETGYRLSALGLTAVATLLVPQAAQADRSGKEVVEAVCATCHATGAKGAPIIGNTQAWSKRASQGLTALTGHAIEGIRDMPAHGGNPNVTDFEIKRAVIYMVNQSGGAWSEPIDKSAALAERTGEQVVQTQCARCHQTGEGGAPRIGDRAAWTPRLQQGLNVAVRSAISGHGGMPARGGLVDLTDAEIRSAVVYMFNPAGTTAKGPTPPMITVSAANRKTIGKTEVYLGVVPAASLAAQQAKRGTKGPMHGSIPSGTDYYHVNISLIDSETKGEITDANVEVTVEDLAMRGETKKLDLIAIGDHISYGNYFQMVGRDPYSIGVRIKRGKSVPVSTKFEFKPS
ncbi:MAG: cytochrome c5 family protein [Betaproteobacteria bacterium]|nr:cytochrome c5 family protein [Betaproteobacteria bacterium]